ncbi:hypothetical protein H8711_09315 [Clostridiaceae bacterium NSJ-31]|uniref:HU domain-containing protein n=1 Tax=Ligaoa zhengdingensis TaxID=2763658 RepID=A0A926DYF1_9FIRM|nr:hypothetical protein [Ligaoa zhengdingensis]
MRKLRSVSEHEAESREPIQGIGPQWNTGYQWFPAVFWREVIAVRPCCFLICARRIGKSKKGRPRVAEEGPPFCPEDGRSGDRKTGRFCHREQEDKTLNQNGLRKKIAARTGVPEDTVETVLEAMRGTVQELLENGEELHWSGFLRMWTVLKRPAAPSGKVLYKDTPHQKIRYRMPDCTFAGSIVQPMKKRTFNLAEKHKASPVSFSKDNPKAGSIKGV